jgi:hypothetical protein
MDWRMLNLIIDLICNPLWRIGMGLAAGLIGFAIWRKWQAGAIAGGIAWASLTGIAYLLNLPLGPPLPALPQGMYLTPDYTQFWLLIGAACGCAWFLDTIILLLIWLELRRWTRQERQS